MKRIQVASKGKRVLSSLIDLSVIAGLFCLFYFLVFYKAVSAVQNFETKNQIIKEERIKSGLYTDDGTVTILIKNPDITSSELNDRLEKFYTIYLRDKVTDKSKIDYTKYWYCVTVLHLEDKLNLIEGEEEFKEENRLFTWGKIDKENPIYNRKTTFTEAEFKEFYKASFGTAVYNLSLNDLTPIKEAAKAISYGNMRAILYSSIASTIIPCFIIPISIKNGKTLGKLATGLIVLSDEGYEYKRYMHIFRYLAFYVVEVFGGVITFGLTIILTSSLVLFSKKHRALHDYIAFSCVADEKHSVYYKDENEENEYKEKQDISLSI